MGSGVKHLADLLTASMVGDNLSPQDCVDVFSKPGWQQDAPLLPNAPLSS